MKIKRSQFITFLLIISIFPFLELLTFEELLAQNPNASLWKAVLSLYSLLRLAFTGMGALYISRRMVCGRTAVAVCLFVIAENFSSLVNGSLYINYTVGSLTMIGLVLVCDKMMRYSWKSYLKACKYFLGLLSIGNLITVIVWPNGFFNAPIKDFAIYLLGSKNTAFFYYLLYFYFVVLEDVIEHKKPAKRNAIWIILFIFSSYRSSSASALLLFAVLLVVYLVWCDFDWFIRHFSFRMVIPSILVIAAFILIAPLRRLFTPLFNLVGRDATITGRDVLWLQAIDAFKRFPVVGKGIDSTFTLETGVIATHAHSMFLDLLAKHGILGFAAFIGMAAVSIRQSIRCRNKGIRFLNILIISVLLIHSILDHLMIYNFILLIATAEGIPAIIRRVERSNEKLLCMRYAVSDIKQYQSQIPLP